MSVLKPHIVQNVNASTDTDAQVPGGFRTLRLVSVTPADALVYVRLTSQLDQGEYFRMVPGQRTRRGNDTPLIPKLYVMSDQAGVEVEFLIGEFDELVKDPEDSTTPPFDGEVQGIDGAGTQAAQSGDPALPPGTNLPKPVMVGMVWPRPEVPADELVDLQSANGRDLLVGHVDTRLGFVPNTPQFFDTRGLSVIRLVPQVVGSMPMTVTDVFGFPVVAIYDKAGVRTDNIPNTAVANVDNYWVVVTGTVSVVFDTAGTGWAFAPILTPVPWVPTKQ